MSDPRTQALEDIREAAREAMGLALEAKRPKPVQAAPVAVPPPVEAPEDDVEALAAAVGEG